MTIEPMGSTMTVQAQTYIQPAKEAAERTDNGGTDSTVVTENPTVDAQTATVAKTAKQDDSNSSDGNTNNQQSDAQNARNKDMASGERIRKVIENLNKNVNHANQEAVFGIHDKTNRVTIKILDKETKEVVKEFPPEKTLDMIAKIWEVAGVLVDEKG